MRAARYYGDNDIRVDEVSDPGIVEPTDALVRVTLASVCGSDLHFFRRGPLRRGRCRRARRRSGTSHNPKGRRFESCARHS